MKRIVIVSLLDVVGVLSSGRLAGNLYLMDNNRRNGSIDQGGEILKTRVNRGDRLIWVVQRLECEAYVTISAVDIDREVCDPKPHRYPDGDAAYWVGEVKRDITGRAPVPYRLSYRLAARREPFSMGSGAAPDDHAALIGADYSPG